MIFDLQHETVCPGVIIEYFLYRGIHINNFSWDRSGNEQPFDTRIKEVEKIAGKNSA